MDDGAGCRMRQTSPGELRAKFIMDVSDKQTHLAIFGQLEDRHRDGGADGEALAGGRNGPRSKP
jgi:hypothetical protein